MKISENILYYLSNRWKPVLADRNKKLGKDFLSDEYNLNYTFLQQYDFKVRNGMTTDIRNKKILEVGCGHGGICLFMAMNGADEVVGIDLDDFRLKFAEKGKTVLEEKYGMAKPLNIKFMNMYGDDLKFPDNYFDMVIVDNVFEHIMNTSGIMKEANRTLKKGGKLVVPVFSSIYSKYGLHLKQGLKMPWANIFFSEKTIVNVMKRLAKDRPELLEVYPGLTGSPETVRDLRKSKDLNDITYKKFKKFAQDSGFKVQSFSPHAKPFILGKFVRKMPFLKNTLLLDIFSTGASSVLVKK